MPEYIRIHTDEEYKAAALLFKEYAAGLNIDLGFQRFEEELTQLKEMYAAPSGGIILCKKNKEWIGSIAIRKLDKETAELKRMYVKPLFRQYGIGSELLKNALALAEELCYKKIRLDTLNTMTAAIKLYRKNGFYEISPYYFNPEKNAVYFEKLL